MKTTATLPCFVTLCLLLTSLPSIARSSQSWSEAKSSIYEQIHALPSFRAKALILMVYSDTDKNSKNLSIATPADVTWAMKVLSLEHLLLAELASEAGWPELSRWFRASSDALVLVIQGEKPLSQFKQEQRVRHAQLKQMVADFMSRNADKANLRPSKAFRALRKRTAAYVSATARIAAGGSKS